MIAGRSQEAGITLNYEPGDTVLDKLWTDRNRLRQIILNLLSNAIKYNRPNGSVTISADQIGDSWIRLSVTDTGAGIPKDKQPFLFEPFNRLGQESGTIEGTGIGLSITKKLVLSLGGKIGVKSEEGKGSTFWVDLPIDRKHQPSRTPL